MELVLGDTFHDAGDPAAHSEFFQQQIAGKLEEKVSGEKDAGSASVHPIAQAKLIPHLKNAESDIDSIQIRDNVQKEQERHQPPHQARDDGGLEVIGSCVQCWFH